nr:thymidylate synthase [Candidatus Sigynarchaeota archaeon]
MRIISSSSLLDAWKQAVQAIKEEGKPATDDNQPIREYMDLFLEINEPWLDPAITKADPAMAAWMHANFSEKKPVSELGNAKSYATRLYDYNGKDQLAGIVKKLKSKAETKSATITTLMPNDDSTYVPCVSLLDFKIRDKKLLLTATCRSLDFGKKALHNFVELTTIGKRVQEACKVPGLELHVHVVSAHIYENDMVSL